IEDPTIRSGDAQYLVIAHSSLMGAELDQLVQIRQADYSVKVVDVAAIYAEFGQHVRDAAAIQAYIKYAVENLNTQYVVIVGSDTHDYKGNNTEYESISLVPTLYTATRSGFIWVTQTPSDAKYGDLDGDGVPDVPVGRIAARTPTELGYVVEKTIDYANRAGYAGRILMASDKEDAGNGISFMQDALDIISVIPSDWAGAVRQDFRAFPDVDGEQAAHDKTIAAMNAGVSVASYIGHSSQQSWAFTDPMMLTTDEVRTLTNEDKPMVVTQWGCWNTYFVHPSGDSMGEAFLVGGTHGAVAVLGASTLTSADDERVLGIELSSRMYQPGKTIGDAAIEAKQAMAVFSNEASIQLGWQILGDPAIVINPAPN
ncbi:MAG: C25 family cysteine peptidase, partial [Pseudomonadota bacterium]